MEEIWLAAGGTGGMVLAKQNITMNQMVVVKRLSLPCYDCYCHRTSV